MMQPTVRIAFDLSLAGGGDFFTLDDPVNGTLDTAPFGLSGEVMTDVSSDVRSISVRRGRASETALIDAGNATIVLDNTQRQYDPTASASVSLYGPSILPRKAIEVLIGSEYVFRGQVEDWDFQYSLNNDSIAVAKSSDGFTILAQQVFASGAGATGLTGAVLYDSASVAGWPLGRVDLDAGNATIGAHTISDGTNVLTYLQQVAGSDPGRLFIGKDGALAFRDRLASQAPTGVVFADDGTGIKFQSIDITYGTELLNTRIEVEWTGGTVVAENADAVAKYGETTLAVKTFLGTVDEAIYVASFFAQRYGEPILRISGLSVNLDDLSSANKNALIGLELGDGVMVKFTPNGIGDPIERFLVVDAIAHEMRPGLGNHSMSFNFSQGLASLILDDVEQGLLDENTIGF